VREGGVWQWLKIVSSEGDLCSGVELLQFTTRKLGKSLA
jgi:hypothetical protein